MAQNMTWECCFVKIGSAKYFSKSVNFEGIEYALACGTKYLKLHKAQIRYLAMTYFKTKNKLKYLDLRQKTEVYLESASQAILPEFEKGM